MKKICLLVILLLGFTATSSGYVLLHPGAIFYGTYQEITFSDTVNCSYIEVGTDYFMLSDMNFTLEGLSSSYHCDYNLSFFNDTFDNHTVSDCPYRFFEFNCTYTNIAIIDIIMDLPGDYFLVDLYIDNTILHDNVEQGTSTYDFEWNNDGNIHRICFYIDGYIPDCSTGGSSTYDANTTRVNLSWNSSSYTDSYVVVRNNASYPSTVTDGYEVQNSSALYYNATLTTNAFFTVWAYNNSGYYSPDSCKLDIPWGALRLNVFNASRTWETVDPFGLTIQNTAGDDIYQKSTCSPPLFLDLNDIPTGTDTIFIINASDYKTQTYSRDTIANTFMNYTFLLPPVETTTPGEGDEDSENHTDSQLYLITLLNEVDQSLMDGLIVFSLYVNETDTYEQVGSFITDGAGQGTIWLVPKKLYKVVCSVPGSDDYQTNTSYWTPSSLLLTKTFKLKYAEDEIQPAKIPQEYITFTTSRTNTTLTIVYDDALLETIDTAIFIYEIDLATGTETLFHTNWTTDVNSFTLTVNGLEANNSYRICLKYNHTTFGYQDPTREESGFRRVLTTPTEFNIMMTNIFGVCPLIWSHVIMFLILVAGMFFADKEDAGKIMIILGGIFLFVNVSIGFDDALTSAAGGIIPILFILVGILMEWKKGRVN